MQTWFILSVLLVWCLSFCFLRLQNCHNNNPITMELDETNFDVIVLGTGFAESVIAGYALSLIYLKTSASQSHSSLARSGKRVLHLDHNDFYGGYMSSYNLSSLDKALRADNNPTPVPGMYHYNIISRAIIYIILDPVAPPNDQVTTIPVSNNVGPIFHNVKIYQTEAPVAPATPVPAVEETQAPVESPSTEPTTTETEPQPEPIDTVPSEAQSAEPQVAEVVTPTQDTATPAQEVESAPSNPTPQESTEAAVEEESVEKEEDVTTVDSVVPFSTLLQDSRHYSIDLAPRLLLARGPMVNLLIR